MRWLLVLVTVAGCDLAWRGHNRDDMAPDASAVQGPDAAVDVDAAIDAAIPIDAPQVDTLPGSADLRVTFADTPIHVAAGAVYAVRASITNAGPATAQGVTLTLTFPVGTMFVSTSSVGWTCTATGSTVSCARSQLTVGVASAVQITATAPASTGSYTFGATVAATTADPSTSNNSASASFVSGSSGTFAAQVAYATGDYPIDVVTGDFNGDGRTDVATANNHNQGSNINALGTVSVLLATATGTLQSATGYNVGYGPQAIAAGNFDGGALDLVTANLAQGIGGNASAIFGTGNGAFTSAVALSACCSPVDVVAGDLNADGKLDLVFANYNAIQVLLGAGTGSFAATVSYAFPGSPQSIALGDMNGDGKLDVVAGYSVYMQPNNVGILLGTGTGTLGSPSLFDTTKGINHLTLVDLDRNGALDVITTNTLTNDISIMRGTGNGTLLAPTHYPVGRTPVAIVAADFNGDGKPDVAVANVDDNTISVRFGNGDGTLQTFSTYATGSGPVSLAVGDFNRDGRPDLVAANAGGDSVSVLLAQP